MIFDENKVKKMSTVELETWKQYLYQKIAKNIQDYDERREGTVKRFVELEAEMDVKKDILEDKSKDSPVIDNSRKTVLEKRVQSIDKQLNIIRDTIKSDELKTNARLDYFRKQIDLIEKEIESRNLQQSNEEKSK